MLGPFRFAAPLCLCFALLAAPGAHAAPQGNEHWTITESRCDEFRSIFLNQIRGKYKLSVKFLAQMNAFMGFNCAQQQVAVFDASTQDRAAYEELLSLLKI